MNNLDVYESSPAYPRIEWICEEINRALELFWQKRDYGFAAPEVLPCNMGRKYLKLATWRDVSGTYQANSVYCFIEILTGNIFKAASWASPVRSKVIGNIYDNRVLGCLSIYGTTTGRSMSNSIESILSSQTS